MEETPKNRTKTLSRENAGPNRAEVVHKRRGAKAPALALRVLQAIRPQAACFHGLKVTPIRARTKAEGKLDTKRAKCMLRLLIALPQYFEELEYNQLRVALEAEIDQVPFDDNQFLQKVERACHEVAFSALMGDYAPLEMFDDAEVLRQVFEAFRPALRRAVETVATKRLKGSPYFTPEMEKLRDEQLFELVSELTTAWQAR